MKTIRTDIDELYEQRQALLETLGKVEAEILRQCRHMKPTETVSKFQYVKESKIIDREQLALYGMKHNIGIEFKSVPDWAKYADEVKKVLSDVELGNLMKVRKAYIKQVKKVA